LTTPKDISNHFISIMSIIIDSEDPVNRKENI
jgi:hypothetical protein